jgi:hypothetical protein
MLVRYICDLVAGGHATRGGACAQPHPPYRDKQHVARSGSTRDINDEFGTVRDLSRGGVTHADPRDSHLAIRARGEAIRLLTDPDGGAAGWHAYGAAAQAGADDAPTQPPLLP